MSWRDYNDPWVCPICGERELTDQHGYVHLVEQHPVDDPPKEEE